MSGWVKSLKQVRRKERDAVFFFVKENFSLLPMKKCLFNEAEMFVLIIFRRNTWLRSSFCTNLISSFCNNLIKANFAGNYKHNVSFFLFPWRYKNPLEVLYPYMTPLVSLSVSRFAGAYTEIQRGWRDWGCRGEYWVIILNELSLNGRGPNDRHPPPDFLKSRRSKLLTLVCFEGGASNWEKITGTSQNLIKIPNIRKFPR